MFPLVIVSLLVVNEATVSSVNGEGCSSVNTTFGPVINMCEAGSWRLGVVYVSVTPTNMGSSTRCGCTMSGEVQGQDITTIFQLKHVNVTTPDCAQTVLTVTRPGKSHDFMCVSFTTPIKLDSTNNITLTLSRLIASSRTSLCLSIIPVNHTKNNTLLTCGSSLQTSTASPTSTDPTTTPSTSTSATSSTPSTTSEVSTSATHTVAPTSTMAASTDEMTSSTDEMTSRTDEMTSSTEPPLTRPGDREPKDNKTDLIPPIVGGVVGGSALLIIVIIIIVAYTRKKQRYNPPQEERPELCNIGSEDVLIDNVLYESSSAYASNQPPQAPQPGPTNGRGVYGNFNNNLGSPSVADDKTSGDQVMFPMGNTTAATSPAAATAAAPTAVSATAAARQPTSDEYAVVNKPGRRQKPYAEVRL